MSDAIARCVTCWHRRTTHKGRAHNGGCSAAACSCTKYINDENRVPSAKPKASAKKSADA